MGTKRNIENITIKLHEVTKLIPIWLIITYIRLYKLNNIQCYKFTIGKTFIWQLRIQSRNWPIGLNSQCANPSFVPVFKLFAYLFNFFNVLYLFSSPNVIYIAYKLMQFNVKTVPVLFYSQLDILTTLSLWLLQRRLVPVRLKTIKVCFWF